MNIYLLILLLGIISTVTFVYGRRKSLISVQGEISRLHSLPNHYGWYAAMVGLLPGLLILALWIVLGARVTDSLVLAHISAATRDLSPFEVNILLNDIRNLAAGDAISRALTPELRAAADYYIHISGMIFWSISLAAIGVTSLGALFALSRVGPDLRSRNRLESMVMFGLVACSVIAILTTIGIVSSLVLETLRFFDKVPVSEFIFGLQWSPQTALRSDQVGSSGAFGAIPLIVGTLLITVIALLVAGPVGLLSAVYMTEFADRKTRGFFKPLLEILAGIPTVVYGFFAALVVAPVIRNTGDVLGLEIASESALAAGLVMGIMIIPLMSSLSDDVISAVPQSLRDGSYGLGATKTETILNIVLPAALPGIVSAFLLAASRAIGETMIVVMAAGMAANLTVNPLEAVTTVTVQIVALLTGDQEFDSAKTLSAFALGLALFITTLALNFLALYVVRKYREQYD